jgi:ankyrin repeat protein
LTTSDVIVKYLILHAKNLESKEKLKQTSIVNKLLNKDSTGMTTMKTGNQDILDIQNLTYLPSDRINSFTTGYENNNYLILSIVNNRFDVFKFLIQDKQIDITFKNSNGWDAIHFIIKHKRFKYLAFLFNINQSDIEDGKELEIVQSIYDSLYNERVYSAGELYNEKGAINSLGQAFMSLDVLTNNLVNPLYLAIESTKSPEINFLLFKSILLLLKTRTDVLPNSGLSALDFILNRKYDKHGYTLLIKSIEKKNYQLLEYLTCGIKLDAMVEQSPVDLYATDKGLQNALHHALKVKSDKFIRYLVRLDADKNTLRSMKDSAEKAAQDYDTGKQFKHAFLHIWDAARLNDPELLEIMLKDYDINEQTIVLKNTPLHIAAANLADKACLYLMNKNCKTDSKNHKGLTPLDVAIYTSNKPFIRKFKAILAQEITDFSGLQNYKLNVTLNTTQLSATALARKADDVINRVREVFKERKIKAKVLFEAIDENKNGILFITS